MSDNSVSIVPKKSNFPDNKSKAKEILEWLISRDIVKPTLSDCILSSGKKGYSVSKGATTITDASGYSKLQTDKKGKVINVPMENYIPTDLATNGLEITTERTVFDTGENGIEELICPNCKENIAYDEWDLSNWTDQINDNMTCPQCGKESEIHNFNFKPNWGFSDLGFTFWNWPPFTDQFIEEFRQRLGCEIDVVEKHI